MRNDARFALGVSRIFAILAIVAGLAAGLFEATVIAGFSCFDSCPPAARYFSQLLPTQARVLAPCIVLAALALLTFLWYCGSTGQRSRANRQIVFFLAGALIGAFLLGGLLLIGKLTLPVTSDGLLQEQPLVTWAQL